MPPSTLGWLDSSPEEQRRMRELLALFEQKESRDELGVASIRDVFSNALFPGTSVLLTRARYYLFVPWCFQRAAANGAAGEELYRRAKDRERELVETLRMTNAGPGIVGARAGAALQTLPSTTYWGGLRRYGIFRHDAGQWQLGQEVRSDDAEELANRRLGDWHPELPTLPQDFPAVVHGGFTLESGEREFLRERIMHSTGGTLLGNLLRNRVIPGKQDLPWMDPLVLDAANDQMAILDHARRFSMAMFGANRLYTLLVAQQFANAGLGGDGWAADYYRDQYRAWAQLADADTNLFRAWDMDDFWKHVRAGNSGIATRAAHFVNEWITVLQSGAAETGAESGSAAQRLVAERERSLKRAQSRLDNTRLLAQWDGRHGLDHGPVEVPLNRAQYSYRWPNVRQILSDILEVPHA